MTGIGENTLAQPVKPPLRERRACLAKLVKNRLTLTGQAADRSHAAFLALGEDACAAAWEMDTVEGAREDSACLLTLLHVSANLKLTTFANASRRMR